jgi:hypothetical protein
MEQEQENSPIAKPVIQKSRKTMHLNDSMEQVTEDVQVTLATSRPHRKTIHQNASIEEEENYSQVIEKSRKSVHENVSMVQELDAVQDSPKTSAKNHFTILDESHSKEAYKDDMEDAVLRRATLRDSIPTVHENQLLSRSSGEATVSFIINETLCRPPEQAATKLSMSPCILSPPHAFQSSFEAFPRLTVYDNHEIEVTEEEVALETEAIAQIKNNFKQSIRKTVHAEVNMTVDGDSNGPSPQKMEILDKNLTYSRDCRKLMNITDAEIISLIDDESNPCLSETGNSNINHSSYGASNSSYQNALKEFVNITIMNSPFNMSSLTPISTSPVQAIDREIAPAIDYCAKLDDLLMKLEQKDTPPPRLAIDDYLEKLNIQPVIIPYYPQMEPDYLMRKIAESKERILREAAERKVKREQHKASQLPLIPPYEFLLKNKLEW